jgi:hypothetical protein
VNAGYPTGLLNRRSKIGTVKELLIEGEHNGGSPALIPVSASSSSTTIRTAPTAVQCGL